MKNEDANIPNRAANQGKAEGERWQSDSDTVERRDKELSPGAPLSSETSRAVPDQQEPGGSTKGLTRDRKQDRGDGRS